MQPDVGRGAAGVPCVEGSVSEVKTIEVSEIELEPSPLAACMAAETTRERDVAYLRLYAEKIRNQTERFWEIPNTRAAVLEGIASRLTITHQGDDEKTRLLKKYLDNHCANSDAEGTSTLCECQLCLDTRKVVFGEPGR